MIIIVGFQAYVRDGSLRWLKNGFRHCFAYQQVDEGWVLCDPVSDGLLLRSAPAIPARALLSAVAALGTSAVAVECVRQRKRMSWLRPVTCVEVCKRLAGKRCGWLITPYQLFRHLALKSLSGE